MAGEKPIVYIFHGDDTFGLQKYIGAMIARMGDPALADLNLTRLDGRFASDNDIRTGVLSMPFLTDRRMVIITNPLAKLSPKGAHLPEGPEDDAGETAAPEPETGKKGGEGKAPRDRFLALLESVPPTTALVLVIDDYLVRRKGQWEWEVLTPTHWLARWADKAGGSAMVRDFLLPRAEEMPGWIRKQVQAEGGQFSQQAVLALAEHLGSDTQAVSQEITKLLTYVNYKRSVEIEDVELLTARTAQADIFKMVDALAERDATQTLKQLHRLLETSEPPEVFGMIVRQFRLMLQAREVLDEGGGVDQIRADVVDNKSKVHPYVADKIAKQAAHFNLNSLLAIYHRLLELDLGMKTSQITFDLAMDTLVAELTQS